MITTHVLDTAIGRPGRGIGVTLEQAADSAHLDREWNLVGRGVTDGDGRLRDLTPASIEAGVYRIRFDTAAYFAANATTTFFPRVEILFRIDDGTQHYHVPLLISPFGYSTYRGS